MFGTPYEGSVLGPLVLANAETVATACVGILIQWGVLHSCGG